jgi:hypothetical protein
MRAMTCGTRANTASQPLGATNVSVGSRRDQSSHLIKAHPLVSSTCESGPGGPNLPPAPRSSPPSPSCSCNATVFYRRVQNSAPASRPTMLPVTGAGPGQLMPSFAFYRQSETICASARARTYRRWRALSRKSRGRGKDTRMVQGSRLCQPEYVNSHSSDSLVAPSPRLCTKIRRA